MLTEVAAGLAAGAAALAYGVRAPRSGWIAPTVWRGPPGSGAIALTFDDGPSESTAELLDLLRLYNAKATFFQCGANAARLPGVARLVAEAGHEIGNHTDSHPFLHFRGRNFIRRELATAQDRIAAATGARPALFRAPYGVRWFGLREVQKELALTGVTWTVIGLDWKWPADRVAARLLRRVRPGAIVCLHDGRELSSNPDISVTLEALRRALPRWVESGLQFKTVSQLLCPTN
jgi:peptidoglycan/xylan/chitin deacetylase (PgdA/CDA1 family)